MKDYQRNLHYDIIFIIPNLLSKIQLYFMLKSNYTLLAFLCILSHPLCELTKLSCHEIYMDQGSPIEF